MRTRIAGESFDGRRADVRNTGMAPYVAMLACLAILLLIGSFCDEALAQALYAPHNVAATLVTTTGIYPFFASAVLFSGVIFERVRHAQLPTAVRVAARVLACVVALAVGFIGAAALLEGDCLGGIIPGLVRNYLAIAVLSLAIEWPLFYLGFRLARRSDDTLLLKRALSLLAVLIVAFVLMRTTKGIFNRPRYRVVAEGLEGIGFVPWYRISPDPSGLIAAYGLERNEFSSFPSGHAVLSMSTIYILLSLAWLVPGLRDRGLVLPLAGFIFGLIIMLSRMILGAHYLSDVAAGALLGVGLACVYGALQRWIDTTASS